MSVIIGSDSQLAFRRTIDDCIKYARRNGVGDFRLGKRAHPRLPYVHPVRYCLDSAPSQGQSQPGYTLNIGLEGLALFCRETIAVGSLIWVRLPLSDGSSVWMEGSVAYCEPDTEYYRAGVAFTNHDDQDFATGPT